MGAEGWRTQDGRHLVLSERQREVLALLAAGHTNGEIGEALGITLDGAKWHVSEIISKLGVRNREEAAAYWRRQRTPTARVSRMLGGLAGMGAWRLAGLTAGSVAVVGLLAGAVFFAGRDDGPPAASPTAAAVPTATAAPTEEPLTAEEILHRSEEFMGGPGTVQIVSQRWPRNNAPQSAHPGIRECDPLELLADDFGQRSLGALRSYPEPEHRRRGASAPEEFEHLGETMVGGEAAWIIRYRYSWPSFEGPILAEDTEWIAQGDFRMLRRETEMYDLYGFAGQQVDVFTFFGPTDEACPAAPDLANDELRPLTTPRLESPHE